VIFRRGAQLFAAPDPTNARPPDESEGRTDMRTPHLALLGAALLTASLTVACSDDDEPVAQTRSIDSTAQSGGNGDNSSGDDDNATTGQGSGGGEGEVLGTSRAELPATPIDERTVPVRMDVIRLERHGDLVELTLRVSNEAPAEGDDPPGFAINDMFGDGLAAYDASGIGLVDGDAQKLYLPVLDSDGTCLCTNDFGSSDIAAGGGTRTISATYGGVPDDVEALDVQVPSFPTIAGVPVR
jgi:hypothetical protein